MNTPPSPSQSPSKMPKKPLTTDESEASDKCESLPIVPGNTDIQMVTTLLQIQNRHQPLTTAKPATNARTL